MTMDTERRVLAILLSALLLDLLAFTLILPLFPSLLEHYARQQQQQADPLFSALTACSQRLQSLLAVPSLERYNNVFFGGILGSLFSGLQFLSSPVFGALSDRHGRKPLLLLSVFGSILSYFLWSISGDSFTLFFCSRLVGGLSKASVSLAIAVVADLVPEERRGKGMAMVGAAFSLAFLLGPSIGAYFSMGARLSAEFDPWPARLAVGLALLELAILWRWLPETLRKSEDKKPKLGHSPPLWSLLCPKALFSFDFLQSSDARLHRQQLQAYSQIYFIFLLLFSGLEFTLGFLTHIRFQYTSAHQGRLYLFSGFCMLIIQGIFVRRVASTAKAQSLGALVGLCAIVPAYLLIAVAFSRTLMYAGLFLYSLSSATVVPFLTTLFSQHCDQSQRGACLGAFRSIGSLARAFGPLLGSLLFWLFGPTASYTIGAVCLLLPVIMLRRIKPALEESAKKSA